MSNDSPPPPKPAWYSLQYAVGVTRSFLRKSVPAVLIGGVSKEETKFLDLKSVVDDRESTIRDGIRLMSNGAAQHKEKMQTVAIELLHFPGGVSPTLATGDPPPSTNSANHEEVFNNLLEARGERVLHPHNVSALVDGYLGLISLCLYRPDNADAAKNLTTPYFDLSPLYGCTEKATRGIRIIDGRGTLRPDCFCEERVQLLPPVVSALLALWNRNHNFLAHNLFIRFSSIKSWRPDFTAEEPAKAKQDEEIFSIVRWINCMQFRNTVAEDILKGLFGLSPFDSSLSLDIIANIQSRPQGGKMRTYKESSFLHTLSPMISQSDASYVGEKMTEIAGGDDIRKHDSSSFRKLYVEFLKGTNQDPTTCNYPGLRRDTQTGQFKDEDLARIFAAARDEPACAPTARNSPSFFKIFHLEALEDERNWKTCTFNEFRKLYGLKPLPSFTTWNADPDIVNAAEKLYGDIDKLGLYVGLQCEATSPSGFGFGFTKTYALIVDLVTRIRSEPAHERSYLSSNNNDYFSTWIKYEIDVDPSRPGNGSVLPKILQRNLPEYYPYNNANTYFLFCTPSSFDPVVIHKLNLNIDKAPERRIHPLSDTTAVQHVFNKPEVYHTLYADSLSQVTNDYGYLLGFDGSKELHRNDRLMTMYALIPDDGSLQRYGSLFAELTASAIKEHKKKNENDSKTRIDIIGDVINEVCTRWVCETLCDYELEGGTDNSRKKSTSRLARPRAPKHKTAKEMHKEFANLYTFIFRSFNHEDGYTVEQQAIASSKYLREHIEAKIPMPEWLLSKSWGEWATQNMNSLYELAHRLIIVYFGGIPLKAHTAQTFLERAVQASRIIPLPNVDLEKRIKEKLNKIAAKDTKLTQKHHDEVERDIEVSRIVANILGLAAVTAVNFPQACSLVVNFYLQEKYTEEREEIVKLSTKVPKTEEEREEIKKILAGYIHEALRISQPLTLWRRAIQRDTIIASDSQITVKEGDVIFADFRSLNNMDINSDKVVPTRRVESLLGTGTHKCPAFTKDPKKSFIDATMLEVIKAIFSLGELSQISGNPHSALNSVQVHPNPSPMDPRAFIGQTGELAYYPQTLVLEYTDSSSPEQAVEEDKITKWEKGLTSNPARKVTKYTEKILAIATTFWIAYKVILILLAFWALILILLGYGAPLRRAVKVVRESDVKRVHVECPEPLTVWDDWGPRVMEAGPEGKPLDIVYNSTLPIPHRLQLFDADKKDTRLALYIDDVLRGLSPDFEVDKDEDCGIEPYDCYIKKFSGADVVVPAGSHSVRIEWAGNEFVNGTTIPDLGEDISRRILWARYYCGPKP